MTRVAARGFTLVEVLVASAIALVVIATAVTLAMEAQGSWRSESARMDLQQRARVAADILTRALRDAGLGPPGPAGGPLIRATAPILPRRIGARRADPPDVVRRDALTVIRALGETDRGVLLLDLPAGASTFEIASSPTCDQPACGLSAGTHVLLLDGYGNADIFTVLNVLGAAVTVRHHGPGAAAAYPAGSPVVPVQTTSFIVDAAARILREYDGDASDLPLVDDVVGMEVEYFGEGRPPARPRAGAGQANCLYGSDGSYNAVLMPALPAPAGLAVLAPSLLSDGPWCGSGASQFDADLLRIRRVRITLRLQAADPAVRGADPTRFRHPGTARRPGAMVPDATVVVDVRPQNLAQGW